MHSCIYLQCYSCSLYSSCFPSTNAISMCKYVIFGPNFTYPIYKNSVNRNFVSAGDSCTSIQYYSHSFSSSCFPPTTAILWCLGKHQSFPCVNTSSAHNIGFIVRHHMMLAKYYPGLSTNHCRKKPF